MAVPRFVRLILALFVAGTLCAAVGCSTPPKPKELVELESILQDPEAREVKEAPGAAKFYREARKYRRVALESYNEGEVERAQEYAILGKLRYRTAAAVADQHKAKARLDESNAKVEQVNPEINALQAERDTLNDEVGALRLKVAAARRKQQEAARRAEALREQRNTLDRGSTNDAAKAKAVRNQIEAAVSAKQAAEAVGANEHAKGTFNRAQNMLKSAQTMFADDVGTTDDIISSAEQAEKLFEQAAREARPAHQEQQAKMEPEARIATLQTKASNTFGAPFTFEEPRGVRIVLAGLFAQGDAAVKPSSRPLLKAAVELAQSYDEFNIRIEGFTREGNATENLATSQVRAKAVRDFLKSEGIDEDRIETTGRGQEMRRFDDASQNDRVEIIFRHGG